MLFYCFICVILDVLNVEIVFILSRRTSFFALSKAIYSFVEILLGLVINLFWLIGVTGAEGRLGGLESHCVLILLRFYLACIWSNLPLNLSPLFLPIECK
jgi:hypothetical protein